MTSGQCGMIVLGMSLRRVDEADADVTVLEILLFATSSCVLTIGHHATS